MVLTDEMVVLGIGGGRLRIKGDTSDGLVFPGNFGTMTPCMGVDDVGGASRRNMLFTASSQSSNNCCT